MARWLKAQAAKPEDPSSVLRTHVVPLDCHMCAEDACASPVNTQIHDIHTEYDVLGTLYHCHQEADLCFRVMNLAAH